MQVNDRVYISGVPKSQRASLMFLEGVVVARGFFKDLVAFPGRKGRRRKTRHKWVEHSRLKLIPKKVT